MLIELEIENLALICRARVAFGTGLNVVTGETGAGKTLLMRALDLIRGVRVDRRQIRAGADSCRVQALFQLEAPLRARVAKLIEPLLLADDQLLVTRVVSREAPGRVYLNGQLAPLATLRNLSGELLDVVGQGEAQRFAEGAYRASLLDLFGGLEAKREAYLETRASASALRGRLDRLLSEAHERRRRLEFLRFERNQIEEADPKPGEIGRLESELSVLEDLERLRLLLGTSLDRLYESDDSLTDRLGRMVREISELNTGARSLLGAATAALERAAFEIAEAVSVLRGVEDGLSNDPARRQVVGERLDVLRTLLDRFGPTEQQLFDYHSRLGAEIADLESDQQDVTTLEEQTRAAEERLERLGTELDRARSKAGSKLSRQVERHLAELGMRAARFSVALLPHSGETVLERAHLSGWSSVQFELAANPGHPPQPLSAVASGGEAARIALAIRKALAGVLQVPTLLFDELDAGIGARLGEAVGRCLESIARHRQVLSVTHLPQVAACADHHVLVRKHSRSAHSGGTKGTEALLEVLTGSAREAEIAAMMRGSRSTPATRSEARQLLEEAGGPHES